MSCCGRKREDLATQVAFIDRAQSARPPWRPERPAPAPRAKVTFEYTGRTAMAVIGGMTRLRYTFIKPGARVEVDAADRASLAAVPHLRQIV